MGVPTQDPQLDLSNSWTITMRIKLYAALCLTIFATFLSVGASAQGQVGKANLCFAPSDWVGKYPSDPGNRRGRLLDLPCVREPLLTLLPKSEYRSLQSELRVDSPIELMGRFLVIARCEAHNCPAHHAMIIVDIDNANIIVGIYRRGSSNSRTTWYSAQSDPLQLPPELLEQFLRRHSPK